MVAGVRMALLAGTFALVLSPAWTQPPPPPVYSDKALEQFAILQDGGPLLVPVTIQGKTHSFILDTGASCTAYDKALAPLLGAPTGRGRVLLATGVEMADQYAAPDAAVGKLPLPKGQMVYVTDLSKARAVGGLDVRGVLGMDFLRHYVVELDHGRGLVTFRQLARPQSGASVPLFMHQGVPWASVCLPGGQREPFMIDTGELGYSSGSLRTGLVKALEAEGKLAPEGGESKFAGAGKRSTVRHHARLEALTFGPVEQRRLLFSWPAQCNTLGLNFWARQVTTFDFPNGMVYLGPPVEHALADEPDRSGLHFLKLGRCLVVQSVDPGSPAARAGLRAEDVLLDVGGAPLDRGSLVPIRTLLSENGKTVPLRVRRGLATFAVSLRLEGWWDKAPPP